MKFKVDGALLRNAGSSILALGGFPGGDKKENQAVSCLLTARKKRVLVEAAGLGIYIKHTLPAVVASEGDVAIFASKIDKISTTGSVEVSSKGEKKVVVVLRYGSTKGEVESPANVKNAITNGRPNAKKEQVHATIPVQTLKDALHAVSFKPGLKEESLRLQLRASKSEFEVSGLDSYSSARVVVATSKKKGVQVKTPFQVALRSNVLTNILKHINSDDEEVLDIGLRYNKKNEPIAVFLRNKQLEVHYPILAVKFTNLGEKIKSFLSKQKVNARFVTTKHELISALADCCALHNKETISALKITITIGKSDVLLSTDTTGSKSRTELKPDKIKLKSKGKSKSAAVHEGYLSSFLALSPDSVPLKVESCGEAYLRMTADSSDSVSVEYFVARVADRKDQSSDQ